jgi:hypothetical protein
MKRIILPHEYPLMVIAADGSIAGEGLRAAGLEALTVENGDQAASILFDAKSPKAPLMLMVDADPLNAVNAALIADLRRHPRLKYMTVVLLHGPSTGPSVEVQGAGVNLMMRKPKDSQGYRDLAVRLKRLLPIGA